MSERLDFELGICFFPPFRVPTALVALLLLCAVSASAQTKWFKYDGNPVLDVGPEGSWDSFYILPEKVLLQDSVYKMWYSGSNGTNATGGGIGYATSPDGVHWRKHPSNPIMQMTPRSWEEPLGLYQGYVLLSKSGYEMWYTGGNTRIGHANSRDGITWTKTGKPVVDIGPSKWDEGWVANPTVIGPDSAGRFKMWFQGADVNRINFKIGYATGVNATTWTKHSEAVLTPGGVGSWGEHGFNSPTVLWNGRY